MGLAPGPECEVQRDGTDDGEGLPAVEYVGREPGEHRDDEPEPVEPARVTPKARENPPQLGEAEAEGEGGGVHGSRTPERQLPAERDDLPEQDPDRGKVEQTHRLPLHDQAASVLEVRVAAFASAKPVALSEYAILGKFPFWSTYGVRVSPSKATARKGPVAGPLGGTGW